MKHFRTLAAATLTLASAFASVACAQGTRRTDERTQIDTTFAFSKTGNVSLSLISGDIRVTAWARDEIRIVATSTLGPMTTSFSQNRVRIEARQRRDRTGRTRYEVSVPVGVEVNASTVSGTINVSGTRGPMSLTSVNGAITASDGNGRSEIETAAGGITLQRFDGTTRISAMAGTIGITEIGGDLDIEQVSGPTRIERANLNNLKFEAVAGTLDLSGALGAQGRSTISTLSGSVTLRLAEKQGVSIELETFQGELHGGDFAVMLRPASGNERGRNSDRQEYAVNGGGARVAIQTFSGSVMLRKLGASERR